MIKNQAPITIFIALFLTTKHILILHITFAYNAFPGCNQIKAYLLYLYKIYQQKIPLHLH